MPRVLCCALLLLLSFTSDAQQYLVYFAGKNSSFSLQTPSLFLGPKAIERRQRYGISLDSADLPVPPAYVQQLQAITGVTVLNVSRWLNAASIQVNGDAALQAAKQLAFVQNAALIGSRIKANTRPLKPMLGKKTRQHAKSVFGLQENFYQYGQSTQQIQLHKGQFLHNIGLRGDSMIIGMLDAGFFRYATLPSLDSANREGRILGTWDFVARDTSVAEDNSHGMQCLSIIAGNIPGAFVGSAPRASFFLYRSEDDRSEKLIEEFNWVCAAERADSSGSDIISSSLGYTDFDGGIGNHTYSDMNGDITLAARGADMAAAKGILVVNSAGNSGNDRWKYLVTPADGDSVLAVGATTASGTPAGFSSYGPSADGRIKPNVASVGVNTTLQAPTGAIGTSNGTSFSAPNISGLAACLWQGFREMNNMQIIAALQESASKATAPDDRVGYGIPDMQKAVGILLKNFTRSEIAIAGCKATITWSSKDKASMQYLIERKTANSESFTIVGTVAPTSQQWGARQYQFTDPLMGVTSAVQYRITQVIDTAASSRYAIYLDTLSIVANNMCSGNDRYLISPNPSSQAAQVILAFSEAQPQLELQLVNTNGQLIWKQQTSKPAGFASFPLPAALLPAGKYYLRIFNAKSQVAVLEFIKL